MNEISNNENKFTVETVAAMLKAYPDLKQKALQLEFEIINYCPALTDEDMIDSMNFNSVIGDYIQNGQIVDKIANIAITYSEKANGINLKHKYELENEFREV